MRKKVFMGLLIISLLLIIFGIAFQSFDKKKDDKLFSKSDALELIKNKEKVDVSSFTFDRESEEYYYFLNNDSVYPLSYCVDKNTKEIFIYPTGIVID